MPNVDVIIPLHGTMPWLKSCMDSIFGQTYTDFKIFLVIDRQASDVDETIFSLEHYKRQKIELLKSPGSGIVAAINHGIENSNGEYIARFDSDDVMCPRRLEKQIDYLRSNPDVGIVGSQAFICDETLNILGITSFPRQHRSICRALEVTNPIIHPAVTFRRSALEIIGKYDPNAESFEDLELWLRARRLTKITNLRTPLIKYRIHKNQVTKKLQSINQNFISAHRMNLRFQENSENRNNFNSNSRIDLDSQSEKFLRTVMTNRLLVNPENQFNSMFRKICQVWYLLRTRPFLLVYDSFELLRKLRGAVSARFYKLFLRRYYPKF